MLRSLWAMESGARHDTYALGTSLDLLGTPSRVIILSFQPLPASFELQPALSTLQHKPPYTKTYPKTYFDPGLTVTLIVLIFSSQDQASLSMGTSHFMIKYAYL
ncbi:hypothetical protein F5877DRAFT_86717 [Lentinula edodes]|nr:hypothetical protein F5877DRAFT_86717 [Lentinula edodes]